MFIKPISNLRSALLIFSLVSLFHPIAVHAQVIPAGRRTTWQGNVGVPGGIPTTRTMFVNVKTTTDTKYKAAGNGSTDDSGPIQAAIDDCPANQYVYLPQGTYRLGTQIRVLMKNNWTIRGDGPGKTILTGGSNTIMAFGSLPWKAEWPAAQAISAGATKGSTTVTVAGTTGISVGMLMGIEQPNDGTLVFGYGGGSSDTPTYYTDDRQNDNSAVLHQEVMVTGISGNQVTFTPPLNFDFTPSLGPRAIGYGGKMGPKFAGVEDLTVNGNTSLDGIDWEGCYACWLKNVEVTNFGKYGLWMKWSPSSEIRESYFHEPAQYGWTRGYAVQFDAVNNLLFENNIYWHNEGDLFLQGGSSGNVFAYNFLFQSYDQYVSLAWQGASFQTHCPYPLMNLYEGNVANAFQADFYYGPSATGTLLRNFITGTNPDIQQHRVAMSIDSHQWNYNIVGNILGSIGTHAPLLAKLPNRTITWANTSPLTWTYDSGTRSFSDAENVIFRLGYPHSGNTGYSGTANPPDNTSQLAALDLSVKNPTPASPTPSSIYTLIHGNWDYSTKTVKWDPNVADHTIPNSMYLTSPPAWFGNLPWPPFDPSNPNAADLTSIPAGYRFVNGVNPPPRTGTPGAPQHFRLGQ